MNKQELRLLILNKRRSFIDPLKSEADLIIQERALFLVDSYQTIGVYLNLKDEVATDLIIERLLDTDKIVCGPKCVGSVLEFRTIFDCSSFKKGMMNIMEPTGKLIDKDNIQVLLIPLVAYDKNLHRLGYGKGYYDRYLADYKGLKIGLAYQCQCVDMIPNDEYDIALDYLINEKEIIRFTK